MTELKEGIIRCLKKQGADLVGFGSIDRFSDTFIQKVMPEARTVICIGFRVLRGSNRGVVDGTTYYQYGTMAVRTLEENVMPLALLRACAYIEDAGFTALPQRRNMTIMEGHEGTHPEVDFEAILTDRFTEPELDFGKTAVLCGLGEIGLHGGLINQEFGPLVRLCAIITNAEIEEDPIAEAHLCDHCGLCWKVCPGNALNENGERDDWQCAVYYNGANMHKNPVLPPYAFAEDPDREAIITGNIRVTPERAKEIIRENIYCPGCGGGYMVSFCGHACKRACQDHLEREGKLQKKYKNPIQPEKDWELPLI